MTKTKYLLYAFEVIENTNSLYFYETDKKYFAEKKPPKDILQENPLKQNGLDKSKIIQNPWLKWKTDNIQEIVTKDGVCINYLKSSDNDYIVIKEDLKLLETYTYLVENYDISHTLDFEMIKKWHIMIFDTIYPFAGELRTVNMSKGKGEQIWEWRLDFLRGVPDFDKLLKKVSLTKYTDIDTMTTDLSVLLSDFLFIHPFREGNGRLSRLICDIILAKNGFPMIGLNLKKSDNYIQRVHEGYECNYEPMKELLQMKIEEELESN